MKIGNLLPALLTSLACVVCAGTEQQADVSAEVAGEMILIFNHPQPDWRDLPAALHTPYVASVRITNVFASSEDLRETWLRNGTGEITVIHSLSAEEPLSPAGLPAQFSFTGLMTYSPRQERPDGYAGTRALHIRKVTGVIQSQKFDAGTINRKWTELKGEDSKQALSALRYLDALVERRMTEDEVLKLFPSQALTKAAAWSEKQSFVLRLSAELTHKVLRPNATGPHYYAISFDKDDRVSETLLVLMGDR
jgi:hypothetical protein